MAPSTGKRQVPVSDGGRRATRLYKESVALQQSMLMLGAASIKKLDHNLPAIIVSPSPRRQPVTLETAATPNQPQTDYTNPPTPA